MDGKTGLGTTAATSQMPTPSRSGRARPNQLRVSYRDFFLINSVWTSFCGSTTLSFLCTKTSREQNSESTLKHLQCLLCVTSRYFVAFFFETVN